MKKKLWFVLLFLLCMGSHLLAGITGKISGVITDVETGDPLIGANVSIEESTLGAATDENGHYFILRVPPGGYTLRVDMMGYATSKKTDVIVHIDRTTQVDFTLKIEAVPGEVVTIIAERPIVEKDLTASKERISGEELENSWINTVNDALSTQSGININRGIRGSFGLDVVYYIDGMELRESGSNSNFTAINTSAIEEMEILTGGYNAEFGQANSGIINIVTKKSIDRIHGSLSYRMRPAGKYHWGRNIFSEENYDHKVMGTLEYWQEHEGGWLADSTAEVRLATWNKFISGKMFNSEEMQDYAERTQHEVEATLYGPITSKMSFLLSGRYLRGVNKYPSPLNYNPEYNFQAKLDYQLSKKTSISLIGLLGGYETTDISRTNFWSSEDSPQRAQGWGDQTQGSSIYYPYEPFKYVYWVTRGRTGDALRPPEYASTYSGQLKLIHTFNPRTFLEVKASHMVFNQEMHHKDVLKVSWGGEGWTWPEDQRPPDNELFVIDGYGDFSFHYNDLKNTKIEASLASQMTPNHYIKLGSGFSYQYYKSVWHSGFDNFRIYMDDYIRPVGFHPYEGFAYLQDKMELEGMIVNAGLRFDFFNANKKVSDTIWDPLRIDKEIEGSRDTTGLISFDPDGPYAVNTPTQIAFSPRLGVSFPITENSVLHFMYGQFHMRPAWVKLLANPVQLVNPPPEGAQVTEPVQEDEIPLYYDKPTVYIDHQKTVGNPALEYEKMIQYEVGFDQNIADLMRIDLTLYYKDGKNLTSTGYNKSGLQNMGTSSTLYTHLYPDKDKPNSVSVGDIGHYQYYTNGGAIDVRGLEATLETNFMRHVKLRLIYNMSYANTMSYGLMSVYRFFEEDSTKMGRDVLWGANNTDLGVVGNTNQRWNPNNTIKIIADFSTPDNLGPEIGNFYPLGNWHLNVFTIYVSGEKYTYHSKDDFSTEPLNRTWKPIYITNMKLVKGFKTFGLDLDFSIDVLNVFNQRTLNLLGGRELEEYIEEGKLPTHHITGEEMTWTIYRQATMPREIFFGLDIRF